MITDLNDRIAKAKGWIWQGESAEARAMARILQCVVPPIARSHAWRNPEGEPAPRPDFTGTLEGVAGMMRALCDWEREIGSTKRWYITHTPNGYTCQRTVGVEVWESYTSKQFGLCVGDAYMSVFGKEA